MYPRYVTRSTFRLFPTFRDLAISIVYDRVPPIVALLSSHHSRTLIVYRMMASTSSTSLQRPQEDTAYIIRLTQPQDPLREIEQPQIDRCLTEHPVLLVPYDSHDPQEGVVDIVRRDNPTRAYGIISSKEKKTLDHHAPGWGYVAFGIILPRLSDGVYQMPHPDDVEYVAIKRLNKKVVQKSLAQGKREDPYKEIYRMQSIGDNYHVLGCIEALEDERHLYIIMPYCEQESLVEIIPWQQGFPEQQAKRYFKEVLENLMYLRQHGICHRDLSPDNCMVYKGRVVFTDLAMSFRIPSSSSFMTPLGGFGKPAYLPPEVFHNLPFDAYACDLWSSVVILFNLLTGEILYRQPDPSDIGFRYFVLARGISQTPVNERTVEVLMDLEDAEQIALWRIASRCLQFSSEVLEIFDQVLRVAMQERITAEEIATSAFLTSS